MAPTAAKARKNERTDDRRDERDPEPGVVVSELEQLPPQPPLSLDELFDDPPREKAITA